MGRTRRARAWGQPHPAVRGWGETRPGGEGGDGGSSVSLGPVPWGLTGVAPKQQLAPRPRLLAGPEARACCGESPRGRPGRPPGPGGRWKTPQAAGLLRRKAARALRVHRLSTRVPNGAAALPRNSPPGWQQLLGSSLGRTLPQTPRTQGAAASAAPQRWPTVPVADFQPAVNFYGVALKAGE